MPQTLSATCCIVGGGPAGMMLGVLLARAGVDVVVLEKHADFLRDFRGDTVHPSTLELIYELGWLNEFLQRPHQEVRQLKATVEGREVVIADFGHLPTHCQFIALMPQWDFLNFLAEKGRAYPGFRLLMEHEVTDLLEENGRVVGATATSPTGSVEVRAALTVAADGRGSRVRQVAHLNVVDLGAPIDVLWMKVSRHHDDQDISLGRFGQGRILVTLNRGDYWQLAFVIAKGQFPAMQERGLVEFRRTLVESAPFLKDRAQELASWDQIKLLTVKLDHLNTWWRDGLLCIGDCAHAMSPVGGVGINLAVQDAVATANQLWKPLREGHLASCDLAAVQQRRLFPTRLTQLGQVFLHHRLIAPALRRGPGPRRPPFAVQLLKRFPVLRRIPARVVGLGLRREKIRSPQA